MCDNISLDRCMHFDRQTRRKLVITIIQSGSDRTLLNERKCSITGRARQSLLTPGRCFVPSARRKCESSWRHQTTIGGKRSLTNACRVTESGLSWPCRRNEEQLIGYGRRYGGSRVRRVRRCAMADGLRVQSPTRHNVAHDPAEERPAAVRGAALADQSGHRAGAAREWTGASSTSASPSGPRFRGACTLSRCLTRSC